MRNTKLLVIAGVALLLAGCSSADPADAARSACISAAEDEVGASIDASAIVADNFSDALFEAGIVDDRESGHENATFTVTGKFTFEKDGTESRRSMLCTVKYSDGEPGEPDLNVISG